VLFFIEAHCHLSSSGELQDPATGAQSSRQEENKIQSRERRMDIAIYNDTKNMKT
jgi:hypothetical protein